MAPKAGGNSKKEAGQARKAETENKKKDAVKAKVAAKEDAEWADGAKSTAKADAAKQKQAEADRKKAEKAALLAEEEKSLASTKPKVAGGAAAKKKKVEPKPAGPGAIAAGGGISGAGGENKEVKDNGPLDIGKKDKGKGGDGKEEPVTIAATGLDQMLDAMELVNARTDKEGMGAKASLIEKHPERRFKAAFEAYFERELPEAKKDHPGLRKQQYHDVLFKQFQKAPENPFNQVLVAYNADKETRVEALQGAMKAKEAKYTMPPVRDDD